jgi:hypothetical protein
MKRITNSQIGAHVMRREEFNNSTHTGRDGRNYPDGTVFARWRNVVEVERQYMVWSFGEHWPLYVYSELTNTWFGNATKYCSPTTNRHSSLAHPSGVEIKWVPVDELKVIATKGVIGAIQQKLQEAA